MLQLHVLWQSIRQIGFAAQRIFIVFGNGEFEVLVRIGSLDSASRA